MSEQLKPLLTSLSLSLANAIVNECLAIRQRENLLPLSVAVLDAGGQLVAFQREDGCGILRYDIAFGKAWAALGMGMSTRLIRDRLAKRSRIKRVDMPMPKAAQALPNAMSYLRMPQPSSL